MKNKRHQLDQIFLPISKPVESKEKPPVFHGNMDEWTNKVVNETKNIIQKNNNSVILLLAGPSCGGKGEAAKKLAKEFTQKNIKSLTISTDNFYKGISEMIFRPVLEKNLKFNEPELQKTIKDLRDITKKSPYKEKLNRTNLNKIEKYLSQKMNLNSSLSQEIIQSAQNNFTRLDFDTPNAIDLKLIKKIIGKINRHESFIIPEYSMKYSEPNDSVKNNEILLINPKDYQVFIIEGIFALNRTLANQADLKTFIATPDRAHLLLRRLFRDVISDDARSEYTPETALMISLRIVMPAAKKHILPTISRADYICENPHTLPEAVNTSYCEVQDKIKISRHELPQICQKISQAGYKLIKKSHQTDYYLVDKYKSAPDKEDYQKYILRAREENNRLELVYKGPRFLNPKNKIIRPAEILVSQNDFGTHYQNINQLLADFNRSGFKTLGKITKVRLLCQKEDIIITIDQVDKLGSFIEFITDKETQIPAINQLKKELGLEKHISYGPYIDQLIQQQS